MLQQLSIKNIALIEKLDIELSGGFNVLSGETGAGKSIIIDALNLVLGERADKVLVRTGTDKARVDGVFDISKNAAAKSILNELGIDFDDDMLVITRELSSDGKSVCRVNSVIVTLSVLKKLADFLADIHGQHEHQLLLKKENHLGFLDSFGGAPVKEAAEKTKCAYLTLTGCKAELKKTFGSPDERERRLDILDFQINEIEKAKLCVGEEEELRAKRALLANAEKVELSLSDSEKMLTNGAIDSIRAAKNALSGIAGLKKEYSALSERLDNLYYELDDVSGELIRECGLVESDPFELERVDDRLDELKKLFRKYGPGEQAVLDFLENACIEQQKLKNAAEEIQRHNIECEKALCAYKKEAKALSDARKSTAKIFQSRVENELKYLGMKNAKLVVDFQNGENTEHGTDIVEFLFSANAGEPVKSLSKIISGGEMSRFMLALKSTAAADAMLSTMVFDEIDTGISGAGAQAVAEKIAMLSRKVQVLAVTHLPQLASMADKHFLISKWSDGSQTRTRASVLTGDALLGEIARLSGGSETELARLRAKEVLEQARITKSKM